MSNYVRYGAPYESRAQSRERWRKIHTKFHVGKWLLMSIGCAVLLTVMAWWVSQGVRFWLPWAYAGFAWLYLAGGLAWSRIRRWRDYVSTMMYMEALEDGECEGPFTREARNRWYKEHGSPWRLQPVPESMRVHESRFQISHLVRLDTKSNAHKISRPNFRYRHTRCRNRCTGIFRNPG